MSDGSEQHEHTHDHAHAAPSSPPFRFETFADAPSAQAAFEAAFPPGSAAEPALQALVDRGAQCKSAGPGRVVCRYVERQNGVAGWCWHVAIDANSEKAIQRIRVAAALLGM